MEQNQTQNPGAAGDANGPAAGPRHGWDEIRDVRRLSRPTHDRMVAGVATGLARHLDVDPLLVRVAFVILAFFGGTGLFLYAGLWLVLPDDTTRRAPVPLDRRSLQFAVLGIAALAVIALFGSTWGGWPFQWQLILVLGLVLFVMSRRNPRTEQWPGYGQDHAPGQAYGQPGPSVPAAWQAQTPAPAATTDDAPAYVARPLDETAPLFGTPLVAPQPSPEETLSSAESPATSASAPDETVAVTRPTPSAWPSAAAVPPTTGLFGQQPGMNFTPPPVPPPAPVVSVRRPRDPRKRGPILFWITLALIALGIGVLGMADVAGYAVADSAYPALALGLTALMLLVGAFWGRAGGLIALGLVAAVATAGTLTSEHWDTEGIRVVPTSAAEAADQHDFKRGEFVLDLTGVTDPENLDARLITVTGGVGRIEVVVPDEVDVDVTASVGMGSLRLLDGPVNEGLGLSNSYGAHSGEERPQLNLNLELGVGEVEVVRPDDATPSDARSSSASPSASHAAPTVTEGALR